MKAEKNENQTVKNGKKQVPIAFVQDKALAKDYAKLLEDNDITVNLLSLQGIDDAHGYETALLIDEEQIEQALDIIKSRSPGEYFYSDLFEYDEQNIKTDKNDNCDDER